MVGEIENDVPVNIGAKGTRGGGGSIPDKVIEIRGMGSVLPVEPRPFLGIGAWERRADPWSDGVTVH